MASVVFEHVTKRFGDTTVIEAFDLSVADGELLVLVGGSGSGKSTILRMLAGLETVTSGKILIDDRDVTDLPPRDRDVAMVFQDYGLYPHMTVRDNLSLGLRLRKLTPPVIERRVAWAAGILGLEPLLDRKPKALSGGQRQRVAMGRAMVREPKVFLFDEPLSNLDAALRAQMRIEIGGLQRRLKTTTVYVTHDQIEAMTMADRIVVLQDGRVEQIGSPLELYDHPANLFVAGFIGSPAMNFVRGRLRRGDDTAWVEANDGTRLPNGSKHGGQDGQEVVYSFRPEQLTLGAASQGIPARILVIEPTGADTHVYCELCNTQICAVFGERLAFKPGETIWVQPKGEVAHVFDSVTGKVLN
jgi:multiple sugar transport system ATP-binding protein